MKLGEVVSLGERLNGELGREYFETGAGIKPEPDFQSIYDRHRGLLGDDALASARGSGSAPLVEWLVDLRIGRAVAALEERQLLWEQRAVLHVDGREIPYLRAPIELQNNADRAFRLALDAARARLGAAEVDPLRRDRFALEHEIIASLRLGADYVAGISALSGIDLDALGAAADGFLRRTSDLYADALSAHVRKRLGVSLGALVRADTGWAFRADGFDHAFPPGSLIETALRQMREMRLDARQDGRVRFDIETREGKQPRAFCVPVRVPDEVYLVIQPSGGHTDYRTFWHELGHAMHFAAIDRGRPFADRWLGDNSVTEAFAMLWDHLTVDRGWLARYTSLGASAIERLRAELWVAELYMLRRYAAKLHYELAFHRRHGDGVADLYAECLTDATRFRFPAEDHLRDLDPGFYSARYLRAWQLEAALAAELTERYNEDWYRNPAAGAFVLDLMQRGQADPADRLALEATGTPLSFDGAIARLEATLG